MANEARSRNQPLLTDEELEGHRQILLDGVAQFNAGYYFQAHETLEDIWYPSPPPARTFLQGIIQLAAGFVHLMRHEYPGTIGLLDAALDKLSGAPADFLGIDIARLVSEARRARDELAALGLERFEEWDQTRIPTIHLLR
ncbi:MAG: DUF309 domain-containing protein [Dehalococcoidia bacterium]